MRRVIPQRSITNGLGAGRARACRLLLPIAPRSPHGHSIPTGITPPAEPVLATSGLVGSHPDPGKMLCLCQLPLCLASKPTWRCKKVTVRHVLAWKPLSPSQKPAPGREIKISTALESPSTHEVPETSNHPRPRPHRHPLQHHQNRLIKKNILKPKSKHLPADKFNARVHPHHCPRPPPGPPLLAGASLSALVLAIACNSLVVSSSSAPDTFSCDRRRSASQGTVTTY